MKRTGGFTLVEMAVVLVIIALLLGGLLMPLSTQVDNERRHVTSTTLGEVSDALLGFAIVHRRLPCPDTNGDGNEDGPPCNDIEGDVPWSTLGAGRNDGWHHRIRYRADNTFTAAIPDPPDTTGGLQVRDLSGAILSTTDPDAPVAVLFSCGHDGRPNAGNDADGALNGSASCANPGTPDAVYIQDAFREDVFDDLLVWLSKNILMNRLVAAGQWP